MNALEPSDKRPASSNKSVQVSIEVLQEQRFFLHAVLSDARGFQYLRKDASSDLGGRFDFPQHCHYSRSGSENL